MRTNPDKEHQENKEAQTSNGQNTPDANLGNGGITMPNAPSIELPKGGGAIRGIGEKFQANPVTGTGTFSIPIALSPGRGDFTPSLSLSYNSGSGNGAYGLGWNIGLPSISRKTQNELPKYQDQQESDTFIMSGAEDLVPKLIKDSGNWVQDKFTESGHEVLRYRPRIEGLFARIERWTDTSTGISYWKSITKDNTTTTYGKSSNSRIANPDNENQIYQWLIEESWDSKGNVIRYEYKTEDAAGVSAELFEKNRLQASVHAQKYLKRVLYGNTVMYSDSNFNSSNEWLFKLILDYGEHDDAAPTEATPQDWNVRQDPFSTFRSGFDIRTYRLCKRILMFHDMTELGGSTLVKSTELHYNENAIATQLIRVTHKGYKSGSSASLPPVDFSYTETTLDDTLRDFDLEDLENLPMGVDGQQYTWSDLYGEGIKGILTEEKGGWFYKRNEGDENYYYDHPVNNTPAPDIRFGAQESVALKPNIGGVQQVSDFNGDGKTELLVRSQELTGFFTLEENGEWSRFKHLENVPLVDWKDPNLKLLDLNGDGVPDVLLSKGHCFSYYPSIEDQGYGDRIDIPPYKDEENGPKLVFADSEQVIHLADMSGDGLTDLVCVRNGEVCYWPNLGHGRFGKKVSMSHTPVLDHPEIFSKDRVRLADMDGSGTTDLVYLGTDHIYYWSNQSGNSFSLEKKISHFPKTNNLTSVSVIDLFGKGTSCLVWSSPLPGDHPNRIRYIDLFGQKPYLLKEVDNNMGALSRYHYAPSTKFYLRDRQEGKPWITKLPFPVQVVERTEQYDQVTGMRFVSRYAYHHGYFDTHEKEFRGFGMVEQWDTEQHEKFGTPGLFQVGTNALDEDSHIPPSYTKSWFHLGFWEQEGSITQQYTSEYYKGDAQAWDLPDSSLPTDLSAEEMRQAMRALKGQLLRSETYAEDGTPESVHPYAVSTANYLIQKVQPLESNKYASFQTIPQEQLSYTYERNPGDPRIAHSLVLATDGYGQVTQAASVAYPRRGTGHDTEQSTGLVTFTENEYINIDNATSAFYRIGVPKVAKGYELTGTTLSGLISKSVLTDNISSATDINYEAVPSSGLEKRRIAEQMVYYWKEDLSNVLPFGETASHAMPYRTLQLAMSPSLVAAVYNNDGTTRVTETMLLNDAKYIKENGDYWTPSDIMIFDDSAFYRINQVNHYTGGSSTFGYDTYNLFNTQSTDSYNNQTNSSIDYRILAAKELTNINGNRQQVEFDAVGMVTKAVVLGKLGESLGDTLSDPTQKFTYDLHNWMNNSAPNWVKTESREEHGNSSTNWVVAYEYTGGMGQPILTKIQAEPGIAYQWDANGELIRDINDAPLQASVNPRWIGTGRVIFNNKGNEVKQYEPYFSNTGEYENENEVREIGLSPILRYDPLGRVIRTDMPDGTFTKVEFDCWEQKSFDQNDTAIDSQWYIDRSSPAVTSPEPSAPDQRAAWLAAKHYNTPQVIRLDVLGRGYLTRDDNGSYDGTNTTSNYFDVHTTLDIEGKKREVRNALNQRTLFSYSILPLDEDGNGEVIYTDSPDGGWRRALNRIDGNPYMNWNERGFIYRNEYDDLKRSTHQWVDEGNGDALVGLTVYGDNIGLSNPENDNLRGQAIRAYNQSGVSLPDKIDFKGNILANIRRLADDYMSTIDWKDVSTKSTLGEMDTEASSILQSTSYTSSLAYDALNRPILVTQPDGSLHRPGYNEAGLLETVDVQLQHESNYTSYVTNINYDAKGQRTRIDYGNGSYTTYEYDEDTLKLTRLKTFRNSGNDLMQDLDYTYDPVGNITEQTDGAQQAQYFSNSVIAPTSKYEYDALYRLSKASGREKNNASAPGSNGYTPFGMNTGTTSSEVLATYCESYQYDALGNMLELSHKDTCNGTENWKRTYVYNTGTANNYLQKAYIGSTVPSTQYTYDAHGNMLTMPHLNALNWDFADQLRSTDKTDESTFYAYSAGERVRKVCYNTNTNKIKYERIYLGGYELYKQYDANENLELERATHHIQDDKRKIALLEVKTVNLGASIPNGSQQTITRYQYTNHLDSASLELDENAALLSYEEYHPFGTTSYSMHTNDSEVSMKRYKYVHKERDDETGLYYYGARYYAPWLCRFVSVDPLKDKYPFYTTYQYAGNKPITFIDLDGMEEGNSSYSTTTPVPPENAKEGDTWDFHDGGLTWHYEFQKGVWEGTGVSGEMLLGEVAITAERKKSFWEKAGEFVYEKVVKNIPVVGGLANAIESFAEGDWKGGLIGLGEAALDGVLLVTTGGLGNLAKTGVKGLAKVVFKETLENYVSGEVSEGMSDAGVPGWAQVALGVTLGIKPKKGKVPSKSGTDANLSSGSAKRGDKGNAHGRLENEKGPDGKNTTEKNHMPSKQAYKLAGFKVSDYMGTAAIMKKRHHRRFTTTGSGANAKAFREEEAALLKEGKFIEAFEKNVDEIRKMFGNQYDEAIEQAREQYVNEVIPILQEQLKAQ